MCILHTTSLLTKRAIATKILKYIIDTKTLLKNLHNHLPLKYIELLNLPLSKLKTP